MTNNRDLIADYINSWTEPSGSFPYKAPSAQLLEKFSYLKHERIKYPLCKRFIEILIVLPLIALFGIVLFPLLIGLAIETRFRKDSLPLIIGYWCNGPEGKFKKWKIRTVKSKAVCVPLAELGDWRAWASEWNADDRLVFGNMIKAIYLDEYPQFFSVISGEMALVGPRPLSEIHFQRDLEQGNFTRLKVRGGIVGLGHVRKGTDGFGDPSFEFEYAGILEKGKCLTILKTDVWIVWRAFRLMIKAEGH